MMSISESDVQPVYRMAEPSGLAGRGFFLWLFYHEDVHATAARERGEAKAAKDCEASLPVAIIARSPPLVKANRTRT